MLPQWHVSSAKVNVAMSKYKRHHLLFSQLIWHFVAFKST
jgi:hypothetical protein